MGPMATRKQNQIIDDLDKLVQELIKNKPDERKVRELMFQLGLPYHPEPVERISRVLEEMNKLVFHAEDTKETHDLR